MLLLSFINLTFNTLNISTTTNDYLDFYSLLITDFNIFVEFPRTATTRTDSTDVCNVNLATDSSSETIIDTPPTTTDNPNGDSNEDSSLDLITLAIIAAGIGIGMCCICMAILLGIKHVRKSNSRKNKTKNMRKWQTDQMNMSTDGGPMSHRKHIAAQSQSSDWETNSPMSTQGGSSVSIDIGNNGKFRYNYNQSRIHAHAQGEAEMVPDSTPNANDGSRYVANIARFNAAAIIRKGGAGDVKKNGGNVKGNSRGGENYNAHGKIEDGVIGTTTTSAAGDGDGNGGGDTITAKLRENVSGEAKPPLKHVVTPNLTDGGSAVLPGLSAHGASESTEYASLYNNDSIPVAPFKSQDRQINFSYQANAKVKIKSIKPSGSVNNNNNNNNNNNGSSVEGVPAGGIYSATSIEMPATIVEKPESPSPSPQLPPQSINIGNGSPFAPPSVHELMNKYQKKFRKNEIDFGKEIKLIQIMGVGSFTKVYKAMWTPSLDNNNNNNNNNGACTVAVKLFTHTAETDDHEMDAKTNFNTNDLNGNYNSNGIIDDINTTTNNNIDYNSKHKWDVFEMNAQLFSDIDSVLKLPDHPHVVKVFRYSSSPISIITQFVAGGSVKDLVYFDPNNPNPNQKVLTVHDKVIILYKTAKGLAHLHKHHIIHRNIAARNILIGSNIDGEGGITNQTIVKISEIAIGREMDFGIDLDDDLSDLNDSIDLGDNDRYITKQQSDVSARDKFHEQQTEIATLKWMAPESIEDRQFTIKTDVYMFGITMWEIMYGQEPYKSLDALDAAMKVVLNGERPKFLWNLPDELKQLITKCWNKSHHKRPNDEKIRQVLKQLM